MTGPTWLRTRKSLAIRRTTIRPRLTHLEDRAVPASIAWDGGPTGNGTAWLDPVNWAGDVLPGAGDDVVIGGVTGAPFVELSGAASVNSISSDRGLYISGQLGIHGAPSHIARLTNRGAITSAFNISVTEHLAWYDGVFFGGGGLTLEATATGEGHTLNNNTIDGPLVNRGSLTFDSPTFPQELTLAAPAGSFTNAAGATLTLVNGRFKAGPGSSATFTNAGALHTYSASAFFLPVTNAAGGTVEVHSGSLIVAPALINRGSVTGDDTTAGVVTLRLGGSVDNYGGVIDVESAGFSGVTVDGGSFAARSLTIEGELGSSFTGGVLVDLEGADVRLYRPLDLMGAVHVNPVQWTVHDLRMTPGNHIADLAAKPNIRVTGALEWYNAAITGGGGLTLEATATGEGHTLNNNTIDGPLVNRGSLTFDSPTFPQELTLAAPAGSFTNAAGATLTLLNGRFKAGLGSSATFTNAGALHTYSASAFFLPVTNTGFINLNANSLVISGKFHNHGSFEGLANTNAFFASIWGDGSMRVITEGSTFHNGSLAMTLDGPVASGNFDRIIVRGTLNLGAVPFSLDLGPNFSSIVGEVYTLIDGPGTPVGPFVGRPEGSTIAIDGYEFSISYTGGDVSLTTVAVPFHETSTLLAGSAPTPLFGSDSITLTATVTAISGTPFGNVDFYDGSTLLGSASLIGGVATLPLGSTALAVGEHCIRAVYAGEGVFQSSEGTTHINVLAPSTLQGLVWNDFNNDGEVNFGEKAVAGVTVTFTGADDLGNPVWRTTQTDTNGVYFFGNLRPSSAAGYTIAETQPGGLLDGFDALGAVDGSPVGALGYDMFTGIVLHGGSVAENYNFGERPMTTGVVVTGQTATIGFWQNKHGQNLIMALNGGATATQLGDWLAATFPNMYGMLATKTNAQIAEHYKLLFARTAKTATGGPPKLDSQVMATALAVYVTNQALAGTTASAYGFQVTQYGVGMATFNVGNNGAAFNVVNGSSLSVLALLSAVNAGSHNGVLFDLDQNGTINSLEAAYRAMANAVFAAINEAGGI